MVICCLWQHVHGHVHIGTTWWWTAANLAPFWTHLTKIAITLPILNPLKNLEYLVEAEIKGYHRMVLLA